MNSYRIEVPCLGIGECVTVTEDPNTEPEKGEVLWKDKELEVMLSQLEGASEEIRNSWVQFMDAVKRMYPGAELISLDPLRVLHPDLTPQRLQSIPWQNLPRR